MPSEAELSTELELGVAGDPPPFNARLMHLDPLRSIATTHGVFLRSEAIAHGYDDRTLARARHAAVLVRVRHGAYTFAELWHDADDIGRLRIHAQAVTRSYRDRVVLSHTTAAALHGFDTWAVDPSPIHLTRADAGASRREPDVIHHRGRLSTSDVVERDGLLLTNPARSVVDAATLLPVESGLVIADSALRSGSVSKEEIVDLTESRERWPGTQHLGLVHRLADGRKSVGETRSRYLFWSQGLPLPQLQYPVLDHRGHVAGITDFAWPEAGLLGEFDGRVKYGRLLRAGELPGDAVFREKQREDLLRELTGWRMIRLTWVDLGRPTETALRIRRLLRAEVA